jgi:hypothetical protein
VYASQRLGEVDRRHSAGAEGALDAVPIGEGFAQSGGKIVHVLRG